MYRVQFEYVRTCSVAAVARKLKINRKTAERWVKRGQLGLGVRSKPGRGRWAALTSTAASAAVELFQLLAQAKWSASTLTRRASEQETSLALAMLRY